MRLRIKEAREKAGYAQKDLADLVGVKPTTFNGYECGKHDPKSDLLVKIANVCGVTVDYLLGVNIKTAPSISDEALRLALCAAGLEVSRRTVAKYRAQLGIPPAAQRRNAGS